MSSSSAMDETKEKVLPLHLSVALYHIGQDLGTYHWALVLSRGLPGEQPVQIYQITDKRSFWELAHRTVILPHSIQFFGCVEISDNIGITFDQIDRFIRNYEPEAQPNDPPFIMVNDIWSCSAWVLRVLYDLKEAEIIVIPPNMLSVRQRIMARAMLLQRVEERVPTWALDKGLPK